MVGMIFTEPTDEVHCWNLMGTIIKQLDDMDINLEEYEKYQQMFIDFFEKNDGTDSSLEASNEQIKISSNINNILNSK